MKPTRSLACSSLLAVSALLLFAPLRQVAAAESAGNTVLLPTEAERTIDAGPAGWTQTAQVTATGCGTGACPTLVGTWDGAQPTGGALENVLSAPGGHSGQATVTWRSAAFAVPATGGPAGFTLSTTSSYTWTAAADTAPTYTVRLIGAGATGAHTIVDANPVPTPDRGWITSAPVPLTAAVLPPGSVQRLEISVHFSLSDRTGDASVALDNPTIAIAVPAGVASAPVAATPPVPPVLIPPIIGPAASPAGPQAATGDDVGSEGSIDNSTDAQASCTGDDAVAVIGAAASGRRLTIAGQAVRPEGDAVDLLSVDGWLLGHAIVDGQRHFEANLPEPRGAAATTKLYARLADGERSAAVPVRRKNVLRSIRSVKAGLEIQGSVSPGLTRRGRFAVDLELPGVDRCGPAADLPTGAVKVDRRTGAYRALVSTAGLASSGAGAASATTSLNGPVLMRARVIRSGPGLPHTVVRSQAIFGPKS